MSYEQNLFPYTKNFKPNFIKIVLVLIVLGVFCFSLTQDAFIIDRGANNGNNPSFIVFLFGSIAILGGGLLEWGIWLANPISLVSIILFLYYDKLLKRALLLNFVALILSSSFYFWEEVLISESGATSKIISFESGYYLWVVSIFILLIFQLIYCNSVEKIKT